MTTLVVFKGKDGAYPWGGVTQGADGNLYSTTAGNYRNRSQRGFVFKVTPKGHLTNLQRLHGFSQAGLALATDGNFYGTTSGLPRGPSSVFRVTPEGALTTLYSFCSQSNCTDGDGPIAPLIQASDGNLYGTAVEGGANGQGTVFRVTLDGALMTLYSFCAQPNCADGAQPGAPLLQARDGDLYGTTYGGGTCSSNGGCGTIFRITLAGEFDTIYSFCDTCEGGYPSGGLIQPSGGELYGTSSSTAFKITTAGALTTLHSFCSLPDCADGDGVESGLVGATDGNLYGTTGGGGANGYGTLFRLTPGGTLTTLHSFSSRDSEIYGTLFQATNGNLYGTARGLGRGSFGAVFRADLGLHPFVIAVPASGAAGTPVTILGTNLIGVTSVTFGGASAASFTVNSTGSAISTAVPSGATTGEVRVQTTKRVLRSNGVFRVP